ncbi:hypothetical protein BDV59DRAFT_173284 [Aspergillus ambiguus]|uniref:uncharacterized protein n=1 Tax=Aspergillus ambiguus TaxID=176160 RepID=UPI003CCC9ACC
MRSAGVGHFGHLLHRLVHPGCLSAAVVGLSVCPRHCENSPSTHVVRQLDPARTCQPLTTPHLSESRAPLAARPSSPRAPPPPRRPPWPALRARRAARTEPTPRAPQHG